jgi:hypothetical protein
MSSTLTDEDMAELAELGKLIILGLECDINGHGVPCRSDRLGSVHFMKKYLEIHGWKVR